MFVTLKDGSKMEFESGLTALEITKRISEGLARAALVCRVDGELRSMNEVIDGDCAFEVLNFADEEGKAAYRHTCSHILAQAVKNVYPTVKLGIGPAVKDGFYYDFDFRTPITQADFDKIEAEMKSSIKADFPIVRSEVTRQEAEKIIKKFKQPYQLE